MSIQTVYLENPPKGFEYTAKFRSPKINDWILRRAGEAEEILRAPYPEMPCIILEKIDPNEEAVQSASAQLEMELDELIDQSTNLIGSSASCQVIAHEEIDRIKENILRVYTNLLRKQLEQSINN